MNAPAAARTGGEVGPGVTDRASARPLRLVLVLAGANALLLLRGRLVLAGFLGAGVVLWRLIWPTEPLWWNAAWQIGYGQVIFAAIVLVAVHLATGRALRDGMRELYSSFPTSAATRMGAHLAALAGALLLSLLLLGGAAALIEFRGSIGSPNVAVLTCGPLLVISAGAIGVALGTRFPHPLTGLLAAIVLIGMFLQTNQILDFPAAGGLRWLSPWTIPDQLGNLPGPVVGYPPGGAHAVELAGVAVLAAVVALGLTAGRAWHRVVLAVTGVVAVAAICGSGAVQLRPVPAAALNRLVSESVAPVSIEHCTAVSRVRYCVYPGSASLLPAFQLPVQGVLRRLPVPPVRGLTIAQGTRSLSFDDPPLFHGHTGHQLARWKAELATPISTATSPVVYVTVGSWPGSRFALALRTAEMAVKLPTGGSSGVGCVPVDQAREAIAIWLAVTATHASAAHLQAGEILSGTGPVGTVYVNNTPVALWEYPADSSVSPTGPQTTAAGFLLAKAMTSLPEGRVESILGAAWPRWLDWHATDAQLAAALGMPMPSVNTPQGGAKPGPWPVGTGVHRMTAAQRPRRPGQFSPRVLPVLARHIARTMPWATLIAGCLAGTAILAALAFFAGPHYALSQDSVRFCFLPAIVALAFVPRDIFRPIAQAAPLPAWLTSAGRILLALPILAVICWVQLRLMDHTITQLARAAATQLPPGNFGSLPPVYPLLAQLTGWCALTVAAAACCDRSRYADVGGAVAAPISLAVIALARFAPGIDRLLATPPATRLGETIAWYVVAAACLILTCAAMRDRWHRYARRLHRPHPARRVR